MKFLYLAITSKLVALVMQNKNDVAKWLRRDRPAPCEMVEAEDVPGKHRETLAIQVLGNRLADFWHIVFIVVIIGVFLTWALEIEGGVVFLVSGFVMTLVLIAFAGLLVRLVRRVIE